MCVCPWDFAITPSHNIKFSIDSAYGKASVVLEIQTLKIAVYLSAGDAFDTSLFVKFF